MKIFQVVFLLDLDSIFQVSAAEDNVASKTKAVREVLLKFLTFFATQHCASDHNASFSLKWDCKYYMSSVNKSIRQRCSFKDFNLENFEKFENELEDRLKKLKIEQLQSSIEHRETCDLDSASNQNDNTQSKPVTSCQGDNISFKTRVRNLELALKDLLCDYTWDQLYVCSPLRKARRLQQNEETKRKSIESDGTGEVENIVMVISSAPSSLSQLDEFAEGKRKLTQQVLLDNILPQSIYKKFVQTSRIRLFWLDTSDTVYCGSDNKIGLSETRAIYDLFHRSLQKTGGGFIPLNAILPTRHVNNIEPSEKAKCIPVGLEFQIPVATLMSGYLSGGKGIEDIKTQAHNCSRLHLNFGAKESKPVMCNLELLPLFRSNIIFSENGAMPSEKCKSIKISCSNKAANMKSASNMETTSPVKQFEVTCKEETDLNYIPQDIRIIGTVLLSEIHRQLIAKPLVYICCSMDQKTANNQSNADSISLRQILTELAMQQIALLVLCDDLIQGIFFPSNSRCEVALLYALVSEGEASVFTLKARPTSIPKDINSFIQKSLETFKKLSPKKRTPAKTNSKQGDAAMPSTFLETWFIPHPFHKRTLSEMTPTCHSLPSTVQNAQKAILRNLQKAYLPSLMNTKLKESSSNSNDSIPNSDRLRCSPRLKSDSRLNANIPVSKNVPQSSSNPKGIAASKNEQHSKIKKRTSILSDEQMSASGTCAEDNENAMLTNLTTLYKNAIFGDSAVISIAQTVLDVCFAFYKNQDRINAKMCTRDLISKHFLLKPGDVECSTGTKEEAKKWKIREHCFQSIIRMELLEIDPSSTEEYVTQTISHLRKLPFIAGPSMLSSFLQETIVENYYNQLKEAVTEICEELNQPLPHDDANLSPSSSNDILLSPEKIDSIPTSVISQMSMISSISSCSNPSRPFKARRSEVVTRFPSFGDVIHKRKIIISQGNSRLHSTSNTGPLTRSAQKKSKEKLTGTKSAPRNVCRSLFEQGIPATRKYATPLKQHKPTTPNGRHVLRTKNVADTPVHKQVDHPTLRRQSLKRKRTLEFDSQEDEVVEESPDKQEDTTFNTSFNPRRTPKRHSSTLRRKASFYSSQPEPKTEPAMVDSIASSKTPLRRSARKPVQIVCPKTTPDKKLKAKRVLILSDTPERSMRKITPKKAFKGNSNLFSPRRSDRLAGLEDDHKMRTPTRSATSSSPRLCEKQEMKRTPTGSSRKSPRLSKSCMLDLKDSATSEIDQLPHTPFAKYKTRDMTKNPKVSRKLLQTPLKSESKTASHTPAKSISASKIYEEEERVPSTPTRNGIESPNASPTHVFLYGPLAKDFDCLSRSSSPIIPLLSCEMTEFYEDQNQCTSSEAKSDAASSENCDGFRSCQDMEVNFGQYFSTNNTQTTVGGVLQDATVPSDSLTQENTSFMFTPNKTFERDRGSPECTLSLWGIQSSFNSVIGLLKNHTHNFQDTESPKTGSHETIQFSPKPGTASEENMPKTKESSAYSDCYSLQRFTRQASKEIGISLKEFKKLTSEIGHSETSKDCKTPEKKWNSASKLSNTPQKNTSPSPKFSRPVVNSKFTSPTSKSIFHLTNSPILSSISTRTTRYSLKNQMKNGSKDKRV